MKIHPFISTSIQKAEEANELSQLLVLISFLGTFSVIRLVTHLQRAHILPNQSGSLHIHHMVPGILLLLITGYVGISFWSHRKIRTATAILFGIGAALTVDEFALWLFLKDVYWAKQGRDSVDAIVICVIIFSVGVMLTQIHGRFFWKKRKK